jgi:cysteinyl-tRNA synthetase
LMMRGSYRNSLNFTWEALKGAAEARRNLNDFRSRLLGESGADAQCDLDAIENDSAVAKARGAFRNALADDLNTSESLAALFVLRNSYVHGELPETQYPAALALLAEADSVFGLFDQIESGGLSDQEIDQLIVERGEARAAKDFARADAIRDELSAAKITLEDTPDGVKWFRG